MTDRPNAIYEFTVPARPPKRKRPVAWIVGGASALLVLGGVLSQAGTPAPAPVAVPSASSEPTPRPVPASCVEALRQADETIRIHTVINGYAADAFAAIARGDAAAVRDLAKKIQDRQAQLSELDYAGARDRCESGQ